MKRHQDLIDQEANAHNISEAYKVRQAIYDWRQESVERTCQQEEEKSAQEFFAAQSWLRMNESDQRMTFESIAAQGYEYPGICGWILNNIKMKSWLQPSQQTPILWLSGIAGSGKSVMSTQLIKFLETRSDTTVLHHFCMGISSEYDQILKSLIEQLLRQDADLTAYVYHVYVLKKQQLTVPSLENLLQTLILSPCSSPKQPSVWIVLDGVDELQDSSPNLQARLLSLVRRLILKTSSSDNMACKILISSRPSQTFSQGLRRKPTVSLSEEKKYVQAAIQEYSSQRLREMHVRFAQLEMSPEEIHSIGQQISQRADGQAFSTKTALKHHPV